ncbi:MAG: DUF4868 domain-containing protein [Methanoregula sp.]|nr:DUF4868 domain-containing protein [Methanoregula sp.]
MPENELKITKKDIEFGICLKNGTNNQYYLIPTDAHFKELLFHMLTKTYTTWKETAETATVYNPAEKYPPVGRLSLPLDDPMVEKIKQFYDLKNITTDSTKIKNIANLSAYFCIYRTEEGKKIIAVRRAFQFKVASHQKYIFLTDDTLKCVDTKLFKIDNDFDFIITEDEIYIFRITGFEYFAHLEEVILEKARENTIRLGEKLTYINIDRLKTYTSKHPRAARLIASIVARDGLEQTDEKHLRSQCKDKAVEIETIDGKLSPLKANENKFLHVLDRRRYTIRLVKHKKEIYEAGSRDQVQ